MRLQIRHLVANSHDALNGSLVTAGLKTKQCVDAEKDASARNEEKLAQLQDWRPASDGKRGAIRQRDVHGRHAGSIATEHQETNDGAGARRRLGLTQMRKRR